MERGRPQSLVLFKTNSKLTKPRAPGPGPIKKKDWKPMAKKYLKGRCILLHTDGARSYKLGIDRKDHLDGVVHDFVVHKPKKNPRANNVHNTSSYFPTQLRERLCMQREALRLLIGAGNMYASISVNDQLLHLATSCMQPGCAPHNGIIGRWVKTSGQKQGRCLRSCCKDDS